MVNGFPGTIGDDAFNGSASADIASKPLVKLDLDFQRLEHRRLHLHGHGVAGAAFATLERRADRPQGLD